MKKNKKQACKPQSYKSINDQISDWPTGGISLKECMKISHWYVSDTVPSWQRPCTPHYHRSTGPATPCSRSVTKSVILKVSLKVPIQKCNWRVILNWYQKRFRSSLILCRLEWDAQQSTCTCHTSLIACKLVDPSSVVEPLPAPLPPPSFCFFFSQKAEQCAWS